MKEVSFEDGASKDEPSSLEMPKKYKERDLQKTHFFRIAARTFGPPKSRRRIIVAPPMEKLSLEDTQVTHPPEVGQRRQFLPPVCRVEALQRSEGGVSSDGIGHCRAWISQRKKFRAELENFGNMEKWLRSKPLLTELEEKILDTLEAQHRAQQVTALPAQEEDLTSPEPKSSRGRSITPSIQRPCPEAFSILDRYLQDNRLRLVDLYNRTDKAKKKKISSSDLKAVRKEANIPLNDVQLDDLVIFLGSKDAESVNYKELAVGRRSWRQENPEWQHQLKKPKTGSSDPSTNLVIQKGTSENISQPLGDIPKSAYSYLGRSQGLTPVPPELQSNPSSAGRSGLLEPPPTKLEEGRPLTYEDMEEIGKMYRERRRRGKSRPKEWVDQCRVVKSGNAAIDKHSMPSTLGSEHGDMVDRFRREVLLEYMDILQLCHKYSVPLSEELLEQALLYPGDKLLIDSKQLLRLKQPGTSLLSSSNVRPHLYPGARTSHLPPGTQISPLHPGTRTAPKTHGRSRLSALPSGDETSLSSSDPFKKQPLDGISGGKSRLHTSQKPDHKDPEFSSSYPPRKLTRKVKLQVRGKPPAEHSTLNCWTTFEEYQEMTKNLKRKFPHLCSVPHVNAFWPGHLLDKLRIYIPHMTPTPGDAIFSHIKPKPGSYPGIYNNTHTWPVSDQGYVIYGDANYKKLIL
ncbi:EF-hand calcium-binding domain-containing protein 12 [Pleurodeles waltl]